MYAPHITLLRIVSYSVSPRVSAVVVVGRVEGIGEKNNTIHKNGGRPLCISTCVRAYTQIHINIYIKIGLIFIYIHLNTGRYIPHSCTRISINTVPVFNTNAVKVRKS